jgi:hypothetical protein
VVEAGRVLLTYHLKVRPDFAPDAAADLSGYPYKAPLLATAPGSPHGYEVVDPARVEPQLGGEPARRRLVGALRPAWGSSSASCPTTPEWPTQPQARRGGMCSGTAGTRVTPSCHRIRGDQPVGLRRRGRCGATTVELTGPGWTDALTGRWFAGGAPALADLLVTYLVALLVWEDAAA